MFIFGGREAAGRAADTHSLDTRDLSWRREAVGEAAPAARAQHAMSALPGVAGAVCFGGLSADGKALDSLDILDARDPDKVCWWTAERSSSWLGARCGAAAAMLGTRLVLLGGADAEGRPAADALLQLDSLSTALLAAGRPTPPPS